MSVYVDLGVRTWVRCFMTRIYPDPNNFGQTLESPVGLLLPPSDVTVNPGLSVERIATKLASGEMATALKYVQDSQPTVNLTFDAAGPDMEQFIHGRTIATETSFESPVYFEHNVTGTTGTAVATNVYGYTVTEQVPGTDEVYVYTIDAFGSAKELTLVDYTTGPTGDNQIAIGPALALKLSANLVGETIYGKVQATFATGKRMSKIALNEVSIMLVGITFRGDTVKVFAAKKCSPNFGNEIGSQPQRQCAFEILTSGPSYSGKGYDINELPYRLQF